MTRARGTIVDNRPIGHRLVDIVIDSFNARQAICECSWTSGFWSTPALAVDRWKTHAGVEDEL